MKKKGFTLIELLAVVVILGILVTIVGVTVTKSIKDSKEKLYQTQKSSIISSTEMWVADNIERISSGCIYITLKDLQDGGYADLNIKNPKTGTSFTPTATYITITATTVSGNISFTYDVLLTTPSSCSQFQA